MARDSLNAEIARQRQAELTRAAERNSLGAEVPVRPLLARARAAFVRSPAPMSREPERATIADLAAVAREPREFWGDRDLRALHHPLLVHDFGETALVIRGDGGRAAGAGGDEVIAYLFGLLTPSGVGYIHLVAVREGHRREGLARCLYARFEVLARKHEAHALKAFTQPINTRSIAFHRALGFTASETADYAGPGETRTVFWRQLAPVARRASAENAAGLSN
jgi:ribosomal protein S18 acetylase RimI-like enzyme